MSAQTVSGYIQNRTTARLTLDNVHAHGQTGPAEDGWNQGLKLVDVLKSVVNAFSFVGMRLGPSVYASSAALTSSGRGQPAEQMFTNISVVAADVGLAFDAVEGIYVAHSNLVDVGTGVRALTSLGVEPQLQVHNSHINTNRFGIFADGMAQMSLHHLLIYARNSARQDVVGISAVNTVFSNLSNNIFVDNSTRHALDGIVLEGDGNLITGNLFQSARRAIWIKSGQANRIGLQVYGNVVEPLLDQGVGTVRIRPGK
ncbi:MAG: right-handed parallel beta-helix repeat-containing protein, partial [Pseudomonadota bacterium]